MNSLAKILIVDDNPKYLEDVLPMYGYEVEVATDGIKALQLIQQAKPQYNLVLLDVMMPNHNKTFCPSKPACKNRISS